MKEKIIDFILYKSMLVIGLILFAFRFYFLSTVFLVSFFFAWLFSTAVDRIEINKNYKILIYISLWLSIFGEFYLYETFEFYDKLLHFIVPLFLASMIYDYIEKYKTTYPKMIVFFIVLGMLTIFEMFEYSIDMIFKLDMLGVTSRTGSILLSAITDTMVDLILGSLACLIFLIFKK